MNHHQPIPQRLIPSWVPRALALLLGVALLGACKTNVLSSKTEDDARQLIPVPICLKRLPRSTTPGAVVSLSSEEYWSLLLPSYDGGARTIDPSALDCSGRQSLARLSPPDARRIRVDPEKVTLAASADGMKIVWLQSHPLSEGLYEGLMAIMRQRESYMEVYAVGIHRGLPKGTRFTLQRMGPRLVVEAVQEACVGEGSDRRCNASTSVYLMTTGALRHSAAFPIEQLVRMPDRDGYGPVEYRFSASAEYRDTSIELTEHLSVNSKGQGETRSSDLQRALRLENGQLLASGESLWTKTQRELGIKPR
ncbi:MAG TPA: hypothetical protein VNN80_25420 [Polyangiaceae bacterium]|nr:hypothetical protein [Polyangiaceae bacterium]